MPLRFGMDSARLPRGVRKLAIMVARSAPDRAPSPRPSPRGRGRQLSLGVMLGRKTERGRPHTIQEWLEQPSERRLELIDGEFVEKAAPDMPHGNAQSALGAVLRPAFSRKTGGSGPGPGGWWFGTEVDIQLGDDGFRPDIAGWRRERMPTLTDQRPVILRPDWICEVLSYRHEPEGYLNVMTAARGQRVRAEPFHAIEIKVGDLLGDDPE